MKKITTITLIFTLLMTVFLGFSYGESQLNISTEEALREYEKLRQVTGEVQTINSYELLKEYNELSEFELNGMGVDSSQVPTIEEYKKEMQNRVRSLNKMSDKELKNLDYSDEEIKIIRNYEGTEEEIVALSANLSFSLVNEGEYASTSKSYMNIAFHWNWSSQPLWNLFDVVAVGWGGGFSASRNSSDSYIVVFYENTYTGSLLDTVNMRLDPLNIEANAGAYWEFDMLTFKNWADGWAKSGYGRIKAEKNSLETGPIDVIGSYAHDIIIANIGVGISSGGLGASIGFTGAYNEYPARSLQYFK